MAPAGIPRWRYALLRRLLALADVSAVLLAYLSLLLAGDGQAGQFAWSLVVLPLWIVIAKLLGLYDRDERALRHLTVDKTPQLVLWAVLGASAVSVALELGSPGRPSASSALTLAVVAGVSAFVLRASMRLVWRATTPPERVAIIGAPAAARSIRRKLELFPDAHMTVVSEHEVDSLDEIAADPGSLAGVDRLFLVPSSFEWQQFDPALELARAVGVRLSVVPPNRAAFGASVQLSHLADLPVFDYRIEDLSRSTLLLKRALDVTVSALALFVLSPVLLLAAVAIKLEDRGPVSSPSHVRVNTAGRSGCSSSALWSWTPRRSSRISCRSTVYRIRCSSWRTIRGSLVSDDCCGGGASTSFRSSST